MLKTTKKFIICGLLLATIPSAIVSTSQAGLNRAINDEREKPGQRPPHTIFLTGQVLLLNSGVATLKGTPPPPPIVPFAASLRVYLSRGNIFVATVTTDAHGKFAIALPPGQYRIVPDIMRGQQVLAPGDESRIVVGSYEAAPPLELNLAPNSRPSVTITYHENLTD